MKNKALCMIAALLGTVFCVSAQGVHTTEVALLDNERWWGVTLEGLSWTDVAADAAQGVPPREFWTTMLVSSAGRYLWSPQPMDIRPDGRKLVVGSGHEKVSVQQGGKTLREGYLMCCHKNLTPHGKMPAAELFSAPVYRPELRRDITWGQREILDYARRIKDDGLPAGTIAVPEGWCSLNAPFVFSPELFPDPQGMVAELRQLGFRVLLTVTPRMPAFGRAYTDAFRNGYLVDDAEKPYGSLLDLGNEGAFALFRQGFDGLRSRYDFDGYRFECPAVPDAGSRDAFIRNMEKLADGIDVCQVTGTYRRPFAHYVSDAGPVGGGRADATVVDGALSSSLSGDIYKMLAFRPGDLQDERVRVGYMLMALFMPVASVDYLPWGFADEMLYAQFRDALKLRASVAGYVANLVREAERTAEPVIRHMEYQFPRNGFADCDDQFMLGPKYLIAPCLDGTGKRMVRLPKGRWTDRNGKRFKGPLVTEADATQGLIYFESVK